LWGFSPPHFGPPQCCALLYGRAKTSYTAGTLGDIKSEIYVDGGVHAAEKKLKKVRKSIDKIFKWR
jgi:hypothetical protein